MIKEEVLIILGICCWIFTLILSMSKWTWEKRKRMKRSIERGDLFENLLSDEDISYCLRNHNTVITELLEEDEAERFLECYKRIWKNGMNGIIIQCALAWVVLIIILFYAWSKTK